MPLAESSDKGCSWKEEVNRSSQSEGYEDNEMSKKGDESHSGTSNKSDKACNIVSTKGNEPHNNALIKATRCAMMHQRRVARCALTCLQGLLLLNKSKNWLQMQSRFSGRRLAKCHLYTKPYTKGINASCILQDYDLSKFHQLHERGNPKQHFTHFIEHMQQCGHIRWSFA